MCELSPHFSVHKTWVHVTDKVDVIKECNRQLQEPAVYKNLYSDKAESLIKEIQNKLRSIIEKSEYKGIITRTETDFLLSKE